MPVICQRCRVEFGDLENKIEESYNVFGELISKHKCPKCKDEVSHNWDTEEDWNESLEAEEEGRGKQ